MASDQMEYCGDCECKEKCKLALQRGEDLHCLMLGKIDSTGYNSTRQNRVF